MEKSFKPLSGYLMLLVVLATIVGTVYGAMLKSPLIIAISVILFFLVSFGFVIVSPNGSAVLTLFGAYKGTIRENGFFWVNPFFKKEKYR
jgi:regulator of protease activity HflC (stomatin/prohibitin superfamily)